MTDFPDFQAFPNAQSDNIFASYAQLLTPGVHPGILTAAVSWSSVMIIVSPIAGAGRVQITHFADAAATQIIDSDEWPVNAATTLIVRTPLRGKYIRLDINVTSGVSLNTETWANFLSASSERISFPVSNQNLSDFAHALAASGTKTYTSGVIAAGRAQFYFKPYDTAAKLAVSLHAVDELGVSGQLIADWGTPAALLQQVIEVPDVILQMQVTNTDGAAPHTYDFSLTIPPQ